MEKKKKEKNRQTDTNQQNAMACCKDEQDTMTGKIDGQIER